MLDTFLDGHVRPATAADLGPGTILRMGNAFPTDSGGTWISSSFSDCVVVKTRMDGHKDLWVTLARPYAFVHGTGTTSPTVLTGVEQYEVLADRLIGGASQYRLVVMSNNEPAIMRLD